MPDFYSILSMKRFFENVFFIFCHISLERR
nr:MAG TPA: hypothetical protein [Caudoviricetes sp.]